MAGQISPYCIVHFLGSTSVVYLVGIWTGAARKIAASGKPVLLVDDLFAGSGEFLIEYARALREGYRVAGVSSSRFEDVVEAVRCFECIKKLRSCTILDVTDSKGFWGDPNVIKELFGTEVRKINSPEINQAYQQADRIQGDRWAKQWIENAQRVVEPTREEIKKSGAMYVALLDLLSKYQAQAITIDCLGLFYGGKLPAYPCLGFFQLNNDGQVGACEGDLPSTMMMLLMTNLVGRPGYISDPVIDTSKNQIIYAHCVATNKVFGPKGPSNPYCIRNHSEDRKGAAVQSLMPAGELTTSIELNTDRREIVMHQATTVGNVEEDKACRTKLAAEVRGDIDKLMTEWDRFGWHRVTFFGDHRKAVETICALLGIKIVREA
jgi:L-fucose isomerase-like protein